MELAARLTADVGPERARELLDMHEAIDDGELHGHFRLDRQMDVINNDVGIQIRIEIRDELSTNERLFYGLGTGGFQEDATYSPQELDRLMDQAIESGNAVWITP
jgi:hypothetical protein